MEPEKRNHERHDFGDTVYAVMRPDFSNLGKLRNISMGGLCIEYLAETPSSPQCTHVDIFTSHEGFYLPEVPCALVYDEPSVGMQASDFSTCHHRRCGLRFGELSREQELKIRFFIEHHATQ